MSKLWYEQPAGIWEEALPLGNGRLGAMVFGRIANEQIQVNEESMWLGGRVNRINPDFRENLPRVRELLDRGEISKAESLMQEAMSGCPESMHPYQTLGDILFFFREIDEKQVCDYKRELSLDQAVSRVVFRVGDTIYRREYFISHPADCMMMRFSAEGTGNVSFSCRLRRGSCFDGVKKLGTDGIALYGNLGRGGCEYIMGLRAKASSGTVRVVGEHLKVENAKEVVLYFTADTTNQYTGGENKASLEAFIENYKRNTLEIAQGRQIPDGLSGYEREEYVYQAAMQAFLQSKIQERFGKVMPKDYGHVFNEHIVDYCSLYQRMQFELDGASEAEGMPTDKRLSRVSEGEEDSCLCKILFDFGRYLTISSSRKEGLPANLQGIWNKDFFPAWDSKYTININAEMNYWHVESCNLSECHQPLFRLLKKVQQNGRRTAREMYGCRGFVAHHNTDMHGDTAPQDIWVPASYWTLGGAWLSTHLWMHYKYTGDLEFLKEAFPIMAEAALFFVDFLIEKDGYLVTSPTVSPENVYIMPGGERGACCIGATMDNQILRDLFGSCLKAWNVIGQQLPKDCEIPGVEDISELITQIESCMNRLNPTRISESGRIMEWQKDYEEEEPGHRHISHLYGLYPAGQITVDGTPELAAAARKTLEYRLSHGGGHTGWSRAWIMNHYASLWDGEAAYENLQKMLGLSTYPNMFDKHPPFQIDGNFGACAAISGMLAQSNENRIVLLPALPKAWSTGSVKGLCLVGNAELEMHWENGTLKKAIITAHNNYDKNVIYANKSVKLQMQAGEIKELTF